jgi:hypothetical protein
VHAGQFLRDAPVRLDPVPGPRGNQGRGDHVAGDSLWGYCKGCNKEYDNTYGIEYGKRGASWTGSI